MIASIPKLIDYADYDYEYTKKITTTTTKTTTQTTTQKYITFPEPQSGTILEGREYLNASEITIHASGIDSCVVKLKTRGGITKVSFYVRAGETVTVGVPCENLYVYFASGITWYGEDDLFGDNTSYSMDTEIQDFENYTFEYTLYPVTGGNFSETPISADEF